MLSKVVTEFLEERFPNSIKKLEDRAERSPFIRFDPVSPDFGAIELFDDGDEVTIEFGRFTHSHCANYDELSIDEKEGRIAQDVFMVLNDTFADRFEFWVSHRGGGYRRVDWANEQRRGLWARLLDRRKRTTYYKWSGKSRRIKG